MTGLGANKSLTISRASRIEKFVEQWAPLSIRRSVRFRALEVMGAPQHRWKESVAGRVASGRFFLFLAPSGQNQEQTSHSSYSTHVAIVDNLFVDWADRERLAGLLGTRYHRFIAHKMFRLAACDGCETRWETTYVPESLIH